jgi:hypothetical protein
MDHLKDMRVNGKVKLRRILKNSIVGCEMDSVGRQHGSVKASCKHATELLGSIHF